MDKPCVRHIKHWIIKKLINLIFLFIFIARNLKSINPQWNDEKLFQESKRIVNAQWQHIVYNEWLPIILGDQYMNSFGLRPLTQGFNNNYKNNIDPRITNAFATAGFRMGHSLIPEMIKYDINFFT